jgi:hypothetical protein
MKDPIEIEREATDWLISVLEVVPKIIVFVLALFIVFGFIGMLIGFAIRAAKWAIG